MMKIHENAYKHLEVNQVLAIDQNFHHKSGVLSIVSRNNGGISFSYDAAGADQLNFEENQKLRRILYGWSPKNHAAAKEEAEVELGSFSKIKNSSHKDMIHLVPLNVIREVSAVYTDNFKQYGEDWKRLPNAKNVFYDSMMRHLERWHSGEALDPEDGRRHIVKALGNLIFVVWHELKEKKEPMQKELFDE